MSEIPEGYREVPPEDRAKAVVFFERGKTVAATGNYDYAVEMFMQGLNLDPDSVQAHQELRDISLKRKASGGKASGMWGRLLKRSAGDDKGNMLTAEKLLANDPGNTDHMQAMLQSALDAGFFDTVLWLGPIFQKANADDKKPDFNKFIVLRDVYKRLKLWALASDACNYALRIRPDDMELSTEVKNLGAMDTMENAGYARGGSFRDQVRDKDKQNRLMIGDKDYADMDSMALVIAAAEQEFKADPNDLAKAVKLIEAWEKTEDPEMENKAIELLQEKFDQTKQFRFRQRIGQINMKQMSRMERNKRAALAADPRNVELQKDYTEFRLEQLEFELKEFELASEAYPTDMRLKFEIGRRLQMLHRYSDAIPVLQVARNDPKYRVEAGLLLGMCFYDAKYLDEADETFAGIIKDYPVQGDVRSKELFYWRGRTLEEKTDKAGAIGLYSKVAQMDFNYRDVQNRIKRLRTDVGPKPT
ncbi:MAG: tetratricopeptide repeat protein [Tepidisphaeraceae bacterium]